MVRELLRRRARPGLGGGPPVHGDLPDQWEEGAGHEVSAALAISLRSADNLTAFAWDLQARLPGIGAALADGTLTPLKARIISDELKVLDDEHAAQAEKLILDQLDGQTPAQLGRLAAHAWSARWTRTGPPSAASTRSGRRRGCGSGGTTAARARWPRSACRPTRRWPPTTRSTTAPRRTRAAKLRPDARMDQLRVLAFLDILNGITLDTRIAADRAAQAAQASASGDDGSTSQGTPGGPGSTQLRHALGGGTSPIAVTFPPATAPVRAAPPT